jgi:hypothetical protein
MVTFDLVCSVIWMQRAELQASLYQACSSIAATVNLEREYGYQ